MGYENMPSAAMHQSIEKSNTSNGAIEDIEDLIGSDPSASRDVYRAPIVAPKVKPVTKYEAAQEDYRSARKGAVPGTQLVWMKTYGCSHNVSDSEYMQGMLTSFGYRLTEDREEADIWLINSCTVKDPSQSSFMHLVETARKTDRPLVVAGCVPQGDRNLKGLEKVSIVGVQQIDRVVEVVEETLKGNVVRMLSKSKLPRLDLPKIRKNPMIEIVPLSTGCLGACTYCKTKHARGKLGSYEQSAIVKRCQETLKEGVTEIWLSSEDTGAYGRDIGTNLPSLLRDIVAVLPEDVMLRVGMTNPPFILDHLDEIADILNHKNVFSFLHVPVQSGSDRILTAMNREYTLEEFCRVADLLIAKVPDITIATDIICGFPGETDEDFEETMALVRKYRFHILNISQFYPRPGTPAARMKRVRTDIVKGRSRQLTRFFESFEPYTNMVGKTLKVWINTEVTDDGKHTVGHTKNYTKVLLARDDSLIGHSAVVRITAASRFHVNGDIVEVSPQPINPVSVGRFEKKEKKSGSKDTLQPSKEDEEKHKQSSQKPASRLLEKANHFLADMSRRDIFTLSAAATVTLIGVSALVASSLARRGAHS